jgi:type IV secretory pathway VirD2 relaxase
MGTRAGLHQAIEAITDDIWRLDPNLKGRISSAGKTSARTRMLKGLSATRGFSRGAKSGSRAKAGSGAGLPPGGLLDTRQRVIVKAHIAKHKSGGFGAGGGGGSLRAHVRYLERDGSDGAERGQFYDRNEEHLDARAHVKEWSDDRHHFRFIVSPEHGDRLDDLTDYVRESMDRVARDLGEPKLDWIALNHHDTDQPHAHVLVRGAREDGRMLVIPRATMSYGVRSRFQEVAQERLGELSRDAAEERARRQITQNRWTDIDRRLERARDERGFVRRDLAEARSIDGRIARERLQHLETHDLAERTREGWHLAQDLRQRLEAMVLEQDILRQMHRDMGKSEARDQALDAEREANRAMEREAAERIAREQSQQAAREARREDRLERAPERVPEQAQELGPEIANQAPERTDKVKDLSIPAHDLDAQIYERQLIDLDWEIQYRFEAAAGLRSPEEIERFDQETERAIEARGRLLVENGLASENECGVSLTFDGWQELKDNEIALEIDRQLGIEAHELEEAFGSKRGIFLGCVETRDGLFAIAEREIGGLIYGKIDHAPEIEIGMEVTINSSKELVQEIGLDRGWGLEL